MQMTANKTEQKNSINKSSTYKRVYVVMTTPTTDQQLLSCRRRYSCHG